MLPSLHATCPGDPSPGTPGPDVCHRLRPAGCDDAAPHVAPKGHFQGTAAMEIGVPTGTLSQTIDTGKALAEAAARRMSLTPDEERRVFEAGVNFLAVPPAIGPQLAMAYVPLDRFEVGIRNAGGGWRLGARYQLLSHEDGPFDLTVGVGVSRSTYKVPVASAIPVLDVDDFTRYTIDTPILVGTSRSWFRVWAGPRFLYSSFSTVMRLSIPGMTEVERTRPRRPHDLPGRPGRAGPRLQTPLLRGRADAGPGVRPRQRRRSDRRRSTPGRLHRLRRLPHVRPHRRDLSQREEPKTAQGRTPSARAARRSKARWGLRPRRRTPGVKKQRGSVDCGRGPYRTSWRARDE